MDLQAKCAFVIAQAACANAEIAAMQVENQMAAAGGIPPIYTYGDFMAIQNKYHISWNTVIEYLRD